VNEKEKVASSANPYRMDTDRSIIRCGRTKRGGVMGGYDLYGNYYSSSRDALNAETAQMAEIDASHARREIEDIQRRQYETKSQLGVDVDNLIKDVTEIKKRLAEIEKRLDNKEAALSDKDEKGGE
jgi:seryl-tRNA synthetase